MLSEFPHDESLNVVLAGAPGLETRTVLTDPDSRKKINTIGSILTERMIEDPTFSNFIACSKEFTESIGLRTERVARALNQLEETGFADSSMVMLGDSAFCFCSPSDSASVAEILENFWEPDEILTTSVSGDGGRLLA
jgi:pantoate kinase